MTTTIQQPRLRLDPPGTRRLRLAFLTLWFVDLVAAALFFLVPYATELNPITVQCYELFGLPGVVFAASCYAAVVVGIGHVLSEPLDGRFVVLMIVLYALLALNNVPLLLFEQSPLELALVRLE
jgi:hypothetical protein